MVGVAAFLRFQRIVFHVVYYVYLVMFVYSIIDIQNYTCFLFVVSVVKAEQHK